MHGQSLQFRQLSARKVRPLRTRLLRPHLEEGRLCEFERDDDPDTVHFGLLDEHDDPRAVATFHPEPCPQKTDREAIRLRGMCVDEPLQRRGLGRRLLESAMMRLAVRFPSADLLWCNARTSAADFYEKMGFERTGEVFDIDHIGPHIVMWRKLPTARAAPSQ